MTDAIVPLRQRPAWHALQAHHESIQHTHLRTLFADDPARGERMALNAEGIYFDYSKNRITDHTRPGGYLLFFPGSFAFDRADHRAKDVIAEWEQQRAVERIGRYESLLVYRKLEGRQGTS